MACGAWLPADLRVPSRPYVTLQRTNMYALPSWPGLVYSLLIGLVYGDFARQIPMW